MLLVREVMYCKPGKVKPMVEKFVAMSKLSEKMGMGKMKVFLYTADSDRPRVLNALKSVIQVYKLENHAAVARIDALSNRTSTLFDAAGNVTQITDALGHVRQFQYDAVNRVTVGIDGLSNRTSMLFDAAGNVTQITDALAHTRQTRSQDAFAHFKRQLGGRVAAAPATARESVPPLNPISDEPY